MGNFIPYPEVVTTLYRTANWKIEVRQREHGIPHFHIVGPGFAVSVAIETGEVLAGKASAGVIREASAWMQPRRAMVLAEWYRLNPEIDRRRP